MNSSALTRAGSRSFNLTCPTSMNIQQQTLFILLALSIPLGGCGMARSMSQPYTQPETGANAKIRVVTNGRIRFIPNQACVGWDNKDAGIVAAAGPQRMNNHHNGKTVEMKNGATKNKLITSDAKSTPGDNAVATAEVRVPANQPLTVVFDSESYTYDWAYWCDPVSVAFIPEAGEEYEITGVMAKNCLVRARTLGYEKRYPAMKRAEACK